jgi:hypothetical protein
MNSTPKLTNMKTVTVEVNGQQEQMIERLVANDPLKRSPEELIRMGFLEFAKAKRLAKD